MKPVVNSQKMNVANGGGGAAASVDEYYNTVFNVVDDYRWTLSDKRRQNINSPDNLNEVPYVTLKEYKIDESTIQTQLKYYFEGAGSFLSTGDVSNKLNPYENLFPRSNGGVPQNTYYFPYFSDINFELNTPEWQSLDTLEQGSKFVESAVGVFGGQKAAQFTQSAIQGLFSTAGGALAYSYPKVGIMDRPKLWQSHQFRTINIKFPLFNTYGPDDWKQNRELCWVLVNQNLFTKRNIAVGYPPVYYEVLIPGQHYSYAASVTNLSIYNRGNMRRLRDSAKNEDVIVPDVYEVDMTLTDMVMPSRNLFQSIRDKQSELTIS